MERLIKSKDRVRKYAEVFTPKWVVKLMVDNLEEYNGPLTIEATVLEPACGEGVFLIEILERKLKKAAQKNNPKQEALRALKSLYGIDIQEDNVIICRQNLFDMWKAFVKNTNSDDEINAHDILQKNIVVGNFLTKTKNDGTPIEWLQEDE